MSPVEVERLLEAAIPPSGRTTLTFTQPIPSCEDLIRLLERAVVVGNRRGAPLVAIHAPLVDFPDMPDMFWHVPVEDSSRDGVVRLVFERPEMASAA